MTATSRDKILNKLRSARRPFPDAPPRPKQYLSVTNPQDPSPDGLLALFTEMFEMLKGEVFVVDGDDAAREQVLELLKAANTESMLAWDFAHIPVAGLEAAIKATGIEIIYPDTRDEFREEMLEASRHAEIGLTGADGVLASTGSLVVATGAGKGRIPTVLPPIHIAVVTLDQFLPNVEAWVKQQRDTSLDNLRGIANTCFISGPSRTGDIEMTLVLGVHGPGRVQVVVKR